MVEFCSVSLAGSNCEAFHGNAVEQEISDRMKKTLLFSLLMLAAAYSQAQLASLIDAGGNTVNGQVLVHWGDSETPDQEVGVSVLVNGDETKVLNVRRYELEVEPNTQNYFCWGVCYAPTNAGDMPVWQSQSQHSLVLEPGVPANNFHAYHSPMGVIGSNTFRYVWFDVNSPNDTVWVDIQFEVTAVGIEENSTKASLTIYPNPVTGNEVMVAYQGAGKLRGGYIAFRNMVGQTVLTQAINASTGKFIVPVQNLPPGVYFATIEHQDQIMATQRVVISK